MLDPGSFQQYIEAFNASDEELYVQHVPNAAAGDFLKENIPLFECPDKAIEEVYYFRWWTFRKHLKATPDGFVVTEFLPPVPWATKHNTISCAAGHHFSEGRWLRDRRYLDDYATFWFRRGGSPRGYSFWAAHALQARNLVTGDMSLAVDLLPELVANYRGWESGPTAASGETGHLDPNGLFWQTDNHDGMEVSVGGSGYRATINSYLTAEARAIADLARLAGESGLEEEFSAQAARHQDLLLTRLWDEQAGFFKVLPRGEGQPLVDVRELHGYTPWYFGLAPAEYDVAWGQLLDPEGFCAPYGPTTTEQRHPGFAVSYEGHECQWNGPSWPYSTSVTLTALANLLNTREQSVVTRADYLSLLQTYTRCHRFTHDDGRVVPWIDENLNPFTGDWISRTRLQTWENGTWSATLGGRERGKDYNHSTYCDLIISGLVGLRPRADEVVEVNPLVPESAWAYFCLDRVPYHGRLLTICYDRTGEHYGQGRGLRLLADGRELASSEHLTRLIAPLVP